MLSPLFDQQPSMMPDPRRQLRRDALIGQMQGPNPSPMGGPMMPSAMPQGLPQLPMPPGMPMKPKNPMEPY